MSSSESDSEYADVRVFFATSEWKKLTSEEKKCHRQSKNNYEAIRRCGWATKPPLFMSRKLPAPESQQAPHHQDKTSGGEGAAFPSEGLRHWSHGLDSTEEQSTSLPPSPDQPPEGASLGRENFGLSTPERRTCGLRTPEFRTPEFRTPEFRTPELRTPELWTPEFRTPELSTPDLWTEFRTPVRWTPEPEISVLETPDLSILEARTSAARRYLSLETYEEPKLQDDDILSAAEPTTPASAAGAREEQARNTEGHDHQENAVGARGIREVPHRCASCGAAFRRATLLRAHMRTHHAEGKLDSRENCGVDLPENLDLRRHRRTLTRSKPYRCHTCGKRFAQSSNIPRHMRTHTGEKPYKCQTCHKRFSKTDSLRVHMRTHTGDRPYNCQICGKRFTRKNTLDVHSRIHVGDRPYNCQTCGKRFTQHQQLRVHTRTHTGEKPYNCQTCGKIFTRIDNLRRHARTHRGEKSRTL
ncbi:hypothetical protein FOCC_FOCC005793 [Frankliniella occidentalis]|uniref:Zinc finger protein 629 isoform X2 n=1 Tax=Frankliniella occidentalis TaxID=133901 RepID=A0A6J1TJX8_FRAOC|nr:zinc finger protein 629 isoform X2 [Frankliniella occidentalis]KAE8747462.1 hypothetical protein FOCC_FOCC005793 [Frankliniella occidentalis]